MPISKRTIPDKTAKPGQAQLELDALLFPHKTFGSTSLTAPGSPSDATNNPSGELCLNQDPEISLALKKIDDLRAEETKAMLALAQADTNRSLWLEVEQNNAEIFRASKQFHYDVHKNHISTEFEAAEDQQLAIQRRQASEQGTIAQADYELARNALNEVRDQLASAKREYQALLKYRLTGQMEEDVNEQLNPFAGFGAWGQKYGWYLLAFIVFAALVLLYIH
jgi:hypothetical protein